VGDIDFKVIFSTKISIFFEKTRFWKEKSVEDKFALGPTTQATLVDMKKTIVHEMYINLNYI
jgi:hypothetical protein